MSSYSITRAKNTLMREIIRRMNRVREIEHVALDTPHRKRAWSLAINKHKHAIDTYFSHCYKHNIEIKDD